MKKKLKLIIWPIVYFVLTLAICFSGCLVFHSNYYQFIFVAGSSMFPTLNGNDYYANYGIMDNHEHAINRIKRFDIITCYYPWDSGDYAQPYVPNSEANGTDPEYKIKRVIGMPGDTVVINNEIMQISFLNKEGNEETLSYDNSNCPFSRNGSQDNTMNRHVNYTCKDGEYFVMGDNWKAGASTDSADKSHCIYKENITGVLVAIEGVGLRYTKLICPQCGSKVAYYHKTFNTENNERKDYVEIDHYKIDATYVEKLVCPKHGVTLSSKGEDIFKSKDSFKTIFFY